MALDRVYSARGADLDRCPVCETRADANMTAMTYGHERNVERKIRLWIVRQERDRRKGGQSARFKASRDTPGVRPRHAGDVGPR
jgi:hypothetical protein